MICVGQFDKTVRYQAVFVRKRTVCQFLFAGKQGREKSTGEQPFALAKALLID